MKVLHTDMTKPKSLPFVFFASSLSIVAVLALVPAHALPVNFGLDQDPHRDVIRDPYSGFFPSGQNGGGFAPPAAVVFSSTGGGGSSGPSGFGSYPSGGGGGGFAFGGGSPFGGGAGGGSGGAGGGGGGGSFGGFFSPPNPGPNSIPTFSPATGETAPAPTVPEQTSGVPDGGATVILLALAFVGLHFARRMLTHSNLRQPLLSAGDNAAPPKRRDDSV
jgi:hypothetical protein